LSIYSYPLKPAILKFELENTPPFRKWVAKIGVLDTTSPATAALIVLVDWKDTRGPVDGCSDVHEPIGVI
jgi:hypothetical protein